MTRALFAPLARELRRSPLAGAGLAITLPLWYQLVRRNVDLQASATLALVAGAALVGFAFDDHAQPTLNACAVGRTPRRWIRTILVVGLLGSSWVVITLIARAAGAGLGSTWERLPEIAAAAGLAAACAAVGLRAGVRTPGLGAAMTTVLLMCSVTAASFWSRAFHWLPRLGDQTHATRWWVTAAIASAAACWWARDPAGRSRPGCPGPRREPLHGCCATLWGNREEQGR